MDNFLYDSCCSNGPLADHPSRALFIVVVLENQGRVFAW